MFGVRQHRTIRLGGVQKPFTTCRATSPITPEATANVLGEIAWRCPETRVVVLSMQTGQAYVQEALRRGASAYVLKQHTHLLLRAIGEVAQGRSYLSPPLSRVAVEDYARRAEAGIPDGHFVSVCSTGVLMAALEAGQGLGYDCERDLLKAATPGIPGPNPALPQVSRCSLRFPLWGSRGGFPAHDLHRPCTAKW